MNINLITYLASFRRRLSYPTELLSHITIYFSVNLFVIYINEVILIKPLQVWLFNNYCIQMF
jgi:hypothetical protein